MMVSISSVFILMIHHSKFLLQFSGLIGDKEDEMKSREKEKNSGIESGSVETPTWVQ